MKVPKMFKDNGSSSSTPRRGNEVTFATPISVSYEPEERYITEMEQDNYWYTCEELYEMKCKSQDLLAQIEERNGEKAWLDEQENECSRGLEDVRKRQLSRHNYIVGVLDLHNFQLIQYNVDPKGLREFSINKSKKSVARAHARAIADERDANKVYATSKDLMGYKATKKQTATSNFMKKNFKISSFQRSAIPRPTTKITTQIRGL